MTPAKRPHLSVPYIKSLDENNLEDAIVTLHENGQRQVVETINWKHEYPYAPLTAFTIAHSDTHIFIDFFVRCNYLRAVNYENNSHVHQDSCVEFFVSPKGEKPYYNFEFNCIGTIHAACREDRNNGMMLSDEQLAQVKRLPSCGTKPFQELEGMFSWNLAVAIPLSLIGIKYDGNPIDMRANFYKCADSTAAPHFLSWAPIDTPQPDFHRPEFFGDITLE